MVPCWVLDGLIFSSVLPYGGHGMFCFAFCLWPGPAWFGACDVQSQYVLHKVGATDISSHLHVHTPKLYIYTHTQGKIVVCVVQVYCSTCYANAN